MNENKKHLRSLRLFRSKKLHPEHVAAINRALRHNARGKEHNVLIEYTKADGTKTDRKIRPLAVRGKHLLLAHDHNRGEVRSFRMDRVGMVKAAFWAGFEKRSAEAPHAPVWPKVLGGAALLGTGAFLGAKGLGAIQRRIKSYGGNTQAITKHIFGHNDAKAKTFRSYYQGDTRFRHGGIFDHMSGKDLIPDDVHSPLGRQIVEEIGHVRAKGKWSPDHQAYLKKTPEGKWVSTFVTYHRPLDAAKDRRASFLSSIVEWDKKPSPSALDGVRSRTTHDMPKAVRM